MSELKILFLTRILAHYRAGVLTELERQPGLEVVFAAGEDGSGVARIGAGELRRTIVVRNRSLMRFVWQEGALRTLLRERPNVLVAEGDMSIISNWLVAAVARCLGVRVVFWTIGWHKADRAVVSLIRLTYYRLAHGLLIYGRRGIELGADAGYPTQRMHFVGNSSSITNTPMDPTRLPQISLPPGDGWIVCVIRLTMVKRLDLLIRAVNVLHCRGIPAPLVLVGEGPARSGLEDLARELDLDSVYFTGPVYRDKALADIYERAAVTAIPRAAGLTVLQSLRFGVPVVTDDNWDTQMPEAEAIVSGVTGDFYRADDIESFADKLAEWLGRPRDEVRAACQAQVERDWSPRLHAERIMEGVRAVYGR